MKISFLQCRKTGEVTFGGIGWEIWHPCEKCGWNNNHPHEHVFEHYKEISIEITYNKYIKIFRSEERLNSWIDEQIAIISEQV